MWKSIPVFLSSLSLALAWAGNKHGLHQYWHLPAGEGSSVAVTGTGTFIQPIDHSDPSKGNFSQWYMYNTDYWKPGNPIILFTPGEINAAPYTKYLTANRTTGLLAEEIGAAIICIEHRYWGYSSPYDQLTTDNLQQHTLDNAIKDFTNFANNAPLPFANGTASNAKDVPWVIMGGSYSGALSAWIESTSPGTFWAYHASSAPVEAISDYWGYYLPIQQWMPQNCSKDVSLVIDYMDNVLMHGTAQDKYNLKAKFGLTNVTHHDDFMSVLNNGPWLWQSNQLYTGYTAFYQWCDAIEGVLGNPDAPVPGAEGVGVEKALEGYAHWVKDIFVPGTCESYGYDVFQGENNTYCFDSYDANSPLYTDTSLDNQVDRAWVWMTCNEPFGYWQASPDTTRPTLVSRLLTAHYYTRQCGLYFPTGTNNNTYGIGNGVGESKVNRYTGGWDTHKSQRLIYVNGEADPWREAGMSSELRHGGPLQSTPQLPVKIIPGGLHTSDLIPRNGEGNPAVAKVINEVVQQLADWVAEWPKKA